MYIRELYLRKIRPFYHNEQIKILLGVRRSGKTQLLKMIQNELRSTTDSSHIIYLSFELLENYKLREPFALYEYIQSLLVDESKYFLFLDEIQFVSKWPEVVNSLKTKYSNVSIFVTGSNNDLLSFDKDRILGGRTLIFRVMPFTFSEYFNYKKILNNNLPLDATTEFENYMQWGGFPLIFSETTDENKQMIVESIFDSIVLRDIVNKLNLKNSYFLEKVIDYIVSSSGNYISSRKIEKRILDDHKERCSLPKILEYINLVEQSCIVNIVPRFDIIGLKVLEFNNKSYTCDPAFIHYKKSLVNDLYGSIFETIVYNELIARGYVVKTGTVYGKEIDFIATRNDEKVYIQVAYEITEQNKAREFGNFEDIKDNYPKIVISKDKVLLSNNGILHKNIIDFLLNDTI